MKTTYIFKQAPRLAALLLGVSLISACGGESSAEGNETITPPQQSGERYTVTKISIDKTDDSITSTSEEISLADNPELCTMDTGAAVNIAALMSANCNNLSDYNLFEDPTDPTTGPNGRGIPFKLNTPLFTDYASKYRFVFVPDGEVATYNEHEVMDFPEGTVLVKTFTIPADTSNREGTEDIIETRLLINRTSGWKALPYYWNTDADAKLLISGAAENSTLTHNSQERSFWYSVPQASQCTLCHGILADGAKQFKPIGPKARFLNNDYAYESGSENQITHWVNAGILTGAPDINTIDTAATYTDSIDPTALETNVLDLNARSYLDINCAHCHRAELTLPSGFSGSAGGSGLNLEFNRIFNDDTSKFGVCKGPAAGGLGAEEGAESSHPYDVVPGYSDKSYLLYRMNTNSSRHRMPELGRSTVHTEGVALIKEWIDRMDKNSCGITGL